jgi:hypothetical protein
VYWKFLRSGSTAPFTRLPWPTDGSWVEAGGVPLLPCRDGVHACRLGDLPYWLSDELWSVELREPVETADRKVVAGAGRLVTRVPGWSPETARRLAEACIFRAAEHAGAELRAGGLDAQAARLDVHEVDAVAVLASEVAEEPAVARRARAARLCLYVADAAGAVDVWPVASLAYIATRAAAQRSDAARIGGSVAERAWQADWLRTELGLAV